VDSNKKKNKKQKEQNWTHTENTTERERKGTPEMAHEKSKKVYK
jgi:hypothetical protein